MHFLKCSLSLNIRFLLEQYLSETLPEACVNVDTVTAFQAQLRHTRLSGVHTPHRCDMRKCSDDY